MDILQLQFIDNLILELSNDSDFIIAFKKINNTKYNGYERAIDELNCLYIPQKFVQILKLKENDVVTLEIIDGKIIIKK